jgi:thiosulfate/3-mercaptopyruvate sulfurtransferase
MTAALWLLTAGNLFISAPEATRLLPRASVLDVRGMVAYRLGHIAGAVRCDWQRLVDLEADAPEAALADELARLGVARARPVLVYGAAGEGFGEEGRVAWLLRYLGHDDVRILDGGYAAWRRAGGEVELRARAAAPAERFRIEHHEALRARLADVQRAVASASPVVLDVRSASEWNGTTPHGEVRGGHIPGARHLPWTALLQKDGTLRPEAELSHLLVARSLDPGREVIVYCTGGVRSAFVWAVLHSLGYARARNFDGSFAAWARETRLPVAVGGPP